MIIRTTLRPQGHDDNCASLPDGDGNANGANFGES
jgi:hypothetical protein